MKKSGLMTLALVVTLTAALTGCGNDDTEVQACIEQMEQAITDAGGDRALTQDEVEACEDPNQRAFILGE